jgi:hypothetical protein
LFEQGHALTLRSYSGFAGLVGMEEGLRQLFAHHTGTLCEQLAGKFLLLIQRQAHTQPEFCIILEQ